MIGDTYLILESKKPVVKTGAFGAGTARLNSNLLDTHSVHHTGGMCKDSLLNSQQSFFVAPAERVAWLSTVRVLHERTLMVANHTFELNGIPFGFILDGGQYSDGVVIPIATDIEVPHFNESLKLARYLYTDWLDYIESFESDSIYQPRYREEIPSQYQSTRDGFLKTLIDTSRKRMEHRKQMSGMRTKREKDREGFVYVLKSKDANPVHKIGRSRQLDTRIKGFNTKLPFEVDVLHTFKTNDTIRAEKCLHDQYADKRTNGEWFKLTEEDIQAICAIPEMMFEVES